jgi:hypothetical protein
VVGSQIGNLTPGPSFAHNLCYRCLNGSCKATFDIYASRPFQRYKEHLKTRCFDPCNQVLSFRESQRTPKSPFRECECHLHTPSKWGCDNVFSALILIVSFVIMSSMFMFLVCHSCVFVFLMLMFSLCLSHVFISRVLVLLMCLCFQLISMCV